jgi:hypothetical protein
MNEEKFHHQQTCMARNNKKRTLWVEKEMTSNGNKIPQKNEEHQKC